jgi:hypothetical protein
MSAIIRFVLNEAPHGPTVAGAQRMVRRYGVDEAALRILRGEES